MVNRLLVMSGLKRKKVFGNELQPTLRDPRLSQTVCMPGQQLRPDDKAPYYVVPPLIGTSSYNQNMTGYSLLKHVQIDYTAVWMPSSREPHRLFSSVMQISC